MHPSQTVKDLCLDLGHWNFLNDVWYMAEVQLLSLTCKHPPVIGEWTLFRGSTSYLLSIAVIKMIKSTLARKGFIWPTGSNHSLSRRESKART